MVKKINIGKSAVKFVNIEINVYLCTMKIHGNRKYETNENYFKKIDTEEKAYWLGFMYADGWVSLNKRGTCSIGITLAEKDKYHLEKFRNEISPSRKLYKRVMKEPYFGAGNSYYKLEITSKKLFDDLIKLGCVPNKSLILEFPTEEQVPKELISHFIRGYFDGDGTIFTNTIPTFSIISTKEFLINLLEISKIPTTKGIYQKRKNNKNTYYLQIRRNKRFQMFGNYIYNNSSIFLERKKSIFDQYNKDIQRL